MSGSRSAAGAIDVLDRVLDKGIVIDAHVRVAVVGIEILAVEARVVVASIQTYLTHAEAVSYTALAARPDADALAADVPAATALAADGPAATALAAGATPAVPPLIAEPVQPPESTPPSVPDPAVPIDPEAET